MFRAVVNASRTEQSHERERITNCSDQKPEFIQEGFSVFELSQSFDFFGKQVGSVIRVFGI